MLIVLFSFAYIFAVSLCTGFLVNTLLKKLIPVPDSGSLGITGFVVTGLVTLSVYAEVFSIFYRIGFLCHLIMLAGAVFGAVYCRTRIKSLLSDALSSLSRDRTKTAVFAAVIIAAAFFTSRGSFHTDTGIYHAQAIRILEEVGVLRGLGNLQLHFAYNSSYLPLCALFTMSFLGIDALHTMTGFFMALFCIYASGGLWEFGRHERHGGDFSRIAILIYALTNMTGLQSPATDYGTMFMTLYILSAFICYAEEKIVLMKDSDKDIAFYGYLSVLSIFTVSMKLSAAALVLISLLPLVMLVRTKKWKELSLFLLIGFLSFLPYMVRNVIISGYLFYPVGAIDLFDVVWKIPAEYMKNDADQIKVWGRCLYDVARADDPIASWLPLWWDEKQHYEKMLIYSQFVGFILVFINLFYRFREKKIKAPVVLFYATIFLNLAMWFFTAPFIRYGLAFLLLLPLCAIGDTCDILVRKKSIAIAVLSALILINFCSWIDDYFMDSAVFAKHYLAGNYVFPLPFERGNMYEYDMDSITVYVAGPDEVNSYYSFPGSCYGDMVEKTELIGDDLKGGFKAK